MIVHAAAVRLGIEPMRTKGLRDRNSPTCTLSQNGYGANVTQVASWLVFPSYCTISLSTKTRGIVEQTSPEQKLTRSCSTLGLVTALGASALSTVLAQDRFFSDFLSFTFDKQDPQSHHDDVAVCGPKDAPQLLLRI